MINIIKSDLYRIFKGKAVYITLAIVIILTIVSCVGMSSGYIGVSMGSELTPFDTETRIALSESNSLIEYRNIIKSHGSFELDRQIIGQNGNLYYLFIVIVVISLSTDFSNKSIKNTLSSAITRKQYYLSKLMLINFLGTLFILFNNYFSYCLNLIINGADFAMPFVDVAKITLLQLPLLYGIISLLVCFAFVLQKTVLFNTISISFIIVLQLLVIGITNLFKIKQNWFYDYEFQTALAKLANAPANKYILICALLGMVYIIVFNIIGYSIFKKCEIK